MDTDCVFFCSFVLLHVFVCVCFSFTPRLLLLLLLCVHSLCVHRLCLMVSFCLVTSLSDSCCDVPASCFHPEPDLCLSLIGQMTPLKASQPLPRHPSLKSPFRKTRTTTARRNGVRTKGCVSIFTQLLYSYKPPHRHGTTSRSYFCL